MRKALSSAQAYVPEIDFRRWASGVRRREEIYSGGGLLALMLMLLAQARCGGLLLVVRGRQWRCRASWTGASTDISVSLDGYGHQNVYISISAPRYGCSDVSIVDLCVTPTHYVHTCLHSAYTAMCVGVDHARAPSCVRTQAYAPVV